MVRFAEGKSVIIEFKGKFEIESSSECTFDFIEIINGLDYNSTRIAKLCGRTKPESITIDGNIMRIRFHSDSSSNKQGFSLKVIQIDPEQGTNNNVARDYVLFKSLAYSFISRHITL